MIESQTLLVENVNEFEGLMAQRDQGEGSRRHHLERAHGRSCVVVQLFSAL